MLSTFRPMRNLAWKPRDLAQGTKKHPSQYKAYLFFFSPARVFVVATMIPNFRQVLYSVGHMGDFSSSPELNIAANRRQGSPPFLW